MVDETLIDAMLEDEAVQHVDPRHRAAWDEIARRVRGWRQVSVLASLWEQREAEGDERMAIEPAVAALRAALRWD